jgi:IS605 OrfB family transposase
MDQVLTVACKLDVPPDRVPDLEATLTAFASACTWINATTPPELTNAVRIHALAYHEVRGRFGLSANLVCQAIRRVAANRKTARLQGRPVKAFAPTSAGYDARIFTFREDDWTVGLTLIGDRQRFHLAIGDYQRQMLQGRQPTSATLAKRRDGTFYLQIQVKPPAPEPRQGTAVIGIDLGRRDIAHTSEGQTFSGAAVTQVRDHFARQRTAIQRKASKGTRSTRRRCRQLLQRLSGRERRFQTWVNHTISYRLVQRALAADARLALEDLSGIRERTNTQPRSRTERRRANSWAFFQLRQFLDYKARKWGVGLILVDPAYTSQTCHDCLHMGERQGQHFACAHCGLACDADLNGAKVISLRGAAVNRPGGPGLYCSLSDSPRAAESSGYSDCA